MCRHAWGHHQAPDPHLHNWAHTGTGNMIIKIFQSSITCFQLVVRNTFLEAPGNVLGA